MHSTKISLPAATREKVAGILNQVLADLSDLYSQTKQAHWNVRGPKFWMFHKLFDELAGKVEEAVDPLAERITALGGIAKGTVRMAAANSKLPEFPLEQQNEASFLNALIERYAIAANDVRKAIDQADELGDKGSSDLLTGIVRDLDQALWFLEAHTHG